MKLPLQPQGEIRPSSSRTIESENFVLNRGEVSRQILHISSASAIVKKKQEGKQGEEEMEKERKKLFDQNLNKQKLTHIAKTQFSITQITKFCVTMMQEEKRRARKRDRGFLRE